MFNSFEDIRKKADSVRNIDLHTLLEHHGCTKDPRDKAKWHTPRGVISVTGQKFMNWTIGTGGGGAKIGNAHLKWAFSEVVPLMMRECEEAKQFVERKEKKHGKSRAMTMLARKIGRAVYH